MPSLNGKTNIKNEVLEVWHQSMQPLSCQECPVIHIDCKFNVIFMPCEGTRLGYQGRLTVVPMDEFWNASRFNIFYHTHTLESTTKVCLRLGTFAPFR